MEYANVVISFDYRPLNLHSFNISTLGNLQWRYGRNNRCDGVFRRAFSSSQNVWIHRIWLLRAWHVGCIDQAMSRRAQIKSTTQRIRNQVDKLAAVLVSLPSATVSLSDARTCIH